jgi:hypothetical protein
VPEIITSDRGAQFTSALWDALCSTLGIRHRPTTAYHPQASGMIERFHRQLKDSLRSRLCGNQWMEHLPWVLLGLRAAPKEDSGVSSAELLFGSPLTLPGQFLDSAATPPEQFLSRLQSLASGLVPPPTRPVPGRCPLPEELRRARFVYVRRGAAGTPLEPLYDGPFRVESQGDKVFRLHLGQRVETVSVDRLKPHLGTEQPVAASPPRRGRPAARASGPSG